MSCLFCFTEFDEVTHMRYYDLSDFNRSHL